MRSMKKILSFLLVLSMVLSYAPMPALAAEVTCPHHVHDDQCGYVEAVEGKPCTHQCTESCTMKDVTQCVHNHEAAGCIHTPAADPVPCDHVHDDSCNYNEAEDACDHQHGACAYKEAVSESWSCGHVCTRESGCVKAVCAHEHDENCGYVKAVEGKECTFVCEACKAPQVDEAVEAVKAQIDALPAVEALSAITVDEKIALYNGAYLTADHAYNALTEEQKAQVDPAKLMALAAYFADPNNLMTTEEPPTSGNCGKDGADVQWKIENGTLTISGTGDMENYGTTNLPWASYKTNIQTIIIESGVTSIGDGAFYVCNNLTDVIIPDSVTTIGQRAFNGCTSLASVSIPNSVKTIGQYAFYGCAMPTVTIPDSVETIGGNAFMGCTSLTSVTIPDSVTTIGDNAFKGCTSLTSVTIPKSVTTTGNYAFSGCTSLTSVIIPESVTTIGLNAFKGCTSLKTVEYLGTNKPVASGDVFDGTLITSVSVPWNYDLGNSNPTFCEIDAEREAQPTTYTVTIASGITNGTVTANPTSAAAGETITLTATPKDGYRFKEWQVTPNTVTITDNKFIMPEAEVEIQAIFEEEQAVAEVIAADSTTNRYFSLESALNAARFEPGARVKLLRSVTDLTQTLLIEGGSLTLDLNGKELSSSADYTLEFGGGTHSVTGGTVNGSIHVRSESVVTLSANVTTAKKYTVLVDGNGKLTVSGGSIENTNEKGAALAASKNGELTVSDGTISGTYFGVHGSGNSCVKLNGGSISGGTAGVYTDNNTGTPQMTISAGSVSSTGGKAVWTFGGTINVTGGTFSGSVSVRKAAGTVSLSGGTFTGGIHVEATTLKEILAKGYDYYQNGQICQISADAAAITGGDVTVLHTHSWKYEATDINEDQVMDTITAACDVDGCPNTSGGSVTIAVPDSVSYTGNAIEAKVTDHLTPEHTVVYSGDGLVEGKPVNPGTYTAAIKLGTAEISVTYTITDVLSDIVVTAAPDGDVAVPTKGNSQTITLTAMADYAYGADVGVTEDAVWTLAENYAGVSIADNVITLTPEAAALTIKAIATYGGKTGEFEILLTKENAGVLTALGEITGPDSISVTDQTEAQTGTYTITGEDPYGAAVTPAVAWSVTGHEGVSIDADGKLTVPVGVPNGTKLTITATSDTFSKTKEVTVSSKTPQSITAPTAGITVTYGNKPFSLEAEAVGALTYTVDKDDVVSVDAEGKVTVLKAGTATVTVTAAETQDYAPASVTVPITVNPATLTITAENKTAVVGAAMPALTYTVTGLVGKDALTTNPTLTCNADMNTAGEFDIVPSGAAAGDNYTIHYVNGKLTVKKEYKVTVADTTNGTVAVSAAKATEGTQILVTATPKSSWYKLKTLVVTNAAGTSITVTNAGDGKYAFTMPASDVTVTATFGAKVTSVADSSNPKTGDDFQLVLWTGMAMTSLLGAAALILNKKKFYQR